MIVKGPTPVDLDHSLAFGQREMVHQLWHACVLRGVQRRHRRLVPGVAHADCEGTRDHRDGATRGESCPRMRRFVNSASVERYESETRPLQTGDDFVRAQPGLVIVDMGDEDHLVGLGLRDEVEEVGSHRLR